MKILVIEFGSKKKTKKPLPNKQSKFKHMSDGASGITPTQKIGSRVEDARGLVAEVLVFAPKGQALLPLAVRNFKLPFLKCPAIHSMARQPF